MKTFNITNSMYKNNKINCSTHSFIEQEHNISTILKHHKLPKVILNILYYDSFINLRGET